MGLKGKQLSWKITFSRALPDPADLSVLDNWFTQVLAEDDRVGASLEECPPYDDLPGATGQWLYRCLLLTRYILQAARVPVFDVPELVACQPDSANRHQWRITVALAWIDHLPREVYSTALNTSFSLAEWVLTRDPSTAYLEFFFDVIQKQVISPYSRVLPQGKSTLHVLRVAHGKGIPFRYLGGGVYQLGCGARSRLLDRSTTDTDTAMGSKLSQHKLLAARLLRSAGLPAAVHQAVSTPEDAHTLARHIGWPVVVKPSDQDRGLGVAVDVTDEESLKDAFGSAYELSRSRQVLIEQQVEGVCHRLFISHGELLYAVKRLPMSITGDGTRSVSGLVAAEEEKQRRTAPWDRASIIPLDPPTLAAINAAGFSASSVPDKGAPIPLRSIESTEWGGIDEEVSNGIHPENLRIAIAAAKLFRLNVAGIDIISRDIGEPWHENGAIINEVNFAPLLGGGEISRSHIPRFLEQYLVGDGRIPVEVVVGGESAWQAAEQRWQAMLAKGINCYLTNGIQTLGPDEKEVPMPTAGLFHRTRALALSSEVEAILLVIQTDEFLETGLPLELVDNITIIDQHMAGFKPGTGPLLPERARLLARLLDNWKTV